MSYVLMFIGGVLFGWGLVDVSDPDSRIRGAALVVVGLLVWGAGLYLLGFA